MLFIAFLWAYLFDARTIFQLQHSAFLLRYNKEQTLNYINIHFLLILMVKKLVLLSCRCEKGEDVSWLDKKPPKISRRGENCICRLEDAKGNQQDYIVEVVLYSEK